jgi:Flp pilus assembly protein TadD
VLDRWGGWWPWLALLLAAAATLAIVLLARRSRIVLFAAAVWLLALLPVLGLSTFHHQAISTVADRYAYLAMLGPAVLLAAWLARRRGRVAWISGGAAIAACAWLSFAQVPHWRSDETLWRHACEVNPMSPVARNNLGREYQRQGRIADAAPHLERAAELDPRSADILVNLGEVRSAQGRGVEAAALYRRAIELAPGNVRPRIDLGIELAQAGRDAEAAAMLESALALEPEQAEALTNLAVLDLRAGRLESAAARLEQVLAVRPHHMVAVHNLGLVRAAQLRWAEAAEHWGLAIGLGVRTLEIYLRRGDAFIRAGMLDEAEHSYLECTSTHPKAYEPHNNLGLLYIRRGRVEEAVRAFERASALAPEASEPRENLAAARRLLEDGKR